MRAWGFALLALAACGPENEEEAGPQDPWAPLAELSSGQCPDLTTSGRKTFTSAGLERVVNIQIPSNPEPGMPLVFTWHGLGASDQNLVRYTVDGWGLADLAEERNAVIVTPEARTIEIPFAGEVRLWGILHDYDPDLALYDDLRTCVAQELDVDLAKVVSWGHSGGALWTSVLAQERSDTLAAYVEFSGGANLDLPLPDGPYIPFNPDARPLPALLASGGSTDLWPSPDLVIVDFEVGTENLAAHAVDNGSFVVRCKHDEGHFVIPPEIFALGREWLFAHVMEGDSPFAGDRAGELPSLCTAL